MWVYNHRDYPLQTGGNVYFKSARSYANEKDALNLSAMDLKPEIVEKGAGVYLRMNLNAEMEKAATRLVNTELLGKSKVAGLAYENADGSPVVIDSDYFGKKRAAKSSAGPFDNRGRGSLELKGW